MKRLVTAGLLVLVAFLTGTPAFAQDNEEWKKLNDEASLLFQQGKYERGVEVAKKALEIAEKTKGPDDPDVAASLGRLAMLYEAQGQNAQAEPLFERLLALEEKAHGPDHPDVALILTVLGRLYYGQGQYAKAEPDFKRSLAIYEKARGPEHPDVATSLTDLALLYYAQGQYAQAEPLFKRALAIREKALGPDHPGVAASLNNLAEVWHAEGQDARAEPLLKRALAIYEKALGPEHLDVAASLMNLAELCYAQSQYAQAEPLYKRALAIREKAFGPDHPDVAASLNDLAELYHAQSQNAQAEPLYKRALAIREKVLGADHPGVAQSLNNLGELYDAEGQYAQAEPLLKRALAIYEKALGPDHPNVAMSLQNLAALYRKTDRVQEAEALERRATGNRLIFKAKINGQPVKLVLDTGADTATLTNGAAARLGLKVIAPPADAPPVPPGKVLASLTEKFTLALGQIKPYETTFAVVAIPSYVNPDFDGVIPWCQWKNSVVQIDFDHVHLQITDALPPDLGGWNKWNLKADSDFLIFECANGAEAVTIGIDTGDQDGVGLSAKRWKEWRAAHATPAATMDAKLTPGSGLVISEVLRAKTITLGGITLPDVPVTVLAQQAELAFHGCDAVLGVFALTRLQLIIDGKNGVLYTRPIEKSSAEYDYNRLGALFVPKDPEKSDELIAHVPISSPAWDAGIRDGDILLRVGDVDVTKWRTDPRVRASQFWTRPAGTELTLTLLRGDKTYETKVVLAEPVPCE
ncbi:MAG: tetratricopeptide repeat protein [Candidatus Brocadiia bacterium]